MVQRWTARFVKGRYGMYDSVTQMLEELTCAPLSKRHDNARLIFFLQNYKQFGHGTPFMPRKG